MNSQTEKVQFTPGPWRAGSHTSDKWCVCPDWDWPTHRGEGRILAKDIESEADARLISAAPRMYEALKQILKCNYMEVGPIARAAIAAAEGKE